MESNLIKLSELVNGTKVLRNKLVLVVGKSSSGKTALLTKYAEKNSLEVLNLNLLLSEKLLNLSEKQRALKLNQIINDIVRNTNTEIVILDNTELIFDKTLKQNPLELMLQVSRDKTVIVPWSGEVKNMKLLYAENWHNEYQQFNTTGLLILEI